MTQRTAIFLAIALTVFVLVMSSAVALRISAQAVQANNAPEPTSAVENVSADVTQTPTDVSTPTQTSQPTYTATLTPTRISVLAPDRATQIALTVFLNSRAKRQPELVNYKGKMAYEVLLTRGTVYVDAFDGTVLAHVAYVPPQPTPTLAPTQVPPPPPTVTDSNTGNSSGNGGGGGHVQKGAKVPGPVKPPAPNPGGKGGGEHEGGGHDD